MPLLTAPKTAVPPAPPPAAFVLLTPNPSTGYLQAGGAPPTVRCRPVVTGQGAEAPGLGWALYPNPTAGEVRVAYALPAGLAQATLLVHDGLGRCVQTLVLAGATGEVTLQLGRLPNGVYSYVLRSPQQVLQSGKVVKLP